MKNCPTKSTLADRLAGNVSDAESTSIDAHIEICELCQSILEELTSMDGLCDTSQPDESIAATLEQLKRSYAGADSNVVMTWPRSDNLEASNSRPGDTASPWRRGERIGAYELIEQIGSGSTGWLYRANDERLSRHVAVKILRDQLATSDSGRQRFWREARATAALQHDKIVRVYDIGVSASGNPFLVLELIEGISLAESLARTGPLDGTLAAQLALDVADALGAAHDAGLVHRDIKPSNILLPDGTYDPKITDFGLALSDDVDTRLTVEGQITGTPAYMSPEQVIKPHEVDARSDVYSLGVVLYETLTGELPFRGAVRMTLSQILHEEPSDVRSLDDRIPIDLATICHKSMSKEADRRYTTAHEMRDDLQRYLDGSPIQARPISRVERLWKTAKRHPTTFAMAAGIFGLVTAIAIGASISTIWISKARSDAQSAADIANEQRAMALRTLRALVTEVNAEIDSDIVDYDRVQERILHTAENGLRVLAASTPDSQSLSTAEAHHLIGIIRSYLDQPERAIKEQQIAIKQCDMLASSNRLRGPATLLKAKCFAELAHDEVARERELLEESIELAQSAKSLGVTRTDFLELTADLQYRLAIYHSYESDDVGDEESLRQIDYLEQCMATYNELRQSGDQSRLILEDYVSGSIECSTCLADAGRRSDAMRHAQIGVSLGEELVMENQDDLNAQSLLRDGYVQLAAVSKPSPAIKALRRAHEICELLREELLEDSESLVTQLKIELQLYRQSKFVTTDNHTEWLAKAMATFADLRQTKIYDYETAGTTMLDLAAAIQQSAESDTVRDVLSTAIENLEVAIKEDDVEAPDVWSNLMNVYSRIHNLTVGDEQMNWESRRDELLKQIRERAIDIPEESLDEGLNEPQ